MNKKNNKDIIGTALLDYQSGDFSENIMTYSSVAGKDLMELSWLFRTYDQMPLIEQTALQLCEGLVLDVGCGAGGHTLYLQENNFKVKAIDISKGAVETCIERGIKNVEVQNILNLKNEKFDTILALMNGTGLCGKLDNLENFLFHLKSLLTKNGQILIDSSNILYMYEDEFGDLAVPDSNNYYGEVVFQLSYKDQFSDKFDWLFVDFNKLQDHSRKIGLHCEMVKEGYHHDYLARLTIL